MAPPANQQTVQPAQRQLPQPVDVEAIVVEQPPVVQRGRQANRTRRPANSGSQDFVDQQSGDEQPSVAQGMMAPSHSIVTGSAPVAGESNAYASAGIDPTNTVGQAFLETLRMVRDAAASESRSRSGGRPSFLKELPDSTGDSLEWPVFENRFYDSTRDFGYSDSDNIARLQRAVRGDAKTKIRTLLATASSAKSVMNSLKLQYGNPAAIAARISRDITELPSMR